MTTNGRVVALVGLALLVPLLIEAALMLAFHGTTFASLWIDQYGPVIVLFEVAVGGVFLFRAFSRRNALLLLIPYVPLMVVLIQGVALFVAGTVLGDYL